MKLTGQDIQNMAQLTDEEVFERAINNPDAFAIIVDRYQKAFIRKAQDILRNNEDAYDAAQEAFVKIYSKAWQYKKQDGATFKSWAYKILINHCCTLYQKKKKEFRNMAILGEDEILTFADESNTELYDDKLNTEYLTSLISRLPQLLSRVVTLYFLQDIPQKEVAKIEGVSNGVIRARIHRAKKELRKLGGTLF